MTTAEHLEKIKAKCRANLALAEKRTQGQWEATNDSTEDCVFFAVREKGKIDPVVYLTSFPNTPNDAAYIAACAGAGEAGWRSTIAAIDRLAFDTTGNAEAIKLILSFWPEETL